MLFTNGSLRSQHYRPYSNKTTKEACMHLRHRPVAAARRSAVVGVAAAAGEGALPPAPPAPPAAPLRGPADNRPYSSEDFVERVHSMTAPVYDYTRQWYPVGFVRDFDQSTPHRFVLLGTPLVIWYQPAPAAGTGAGAGTGTAAAAAAAGVAPATSSSSSSSSSSTSSAPHTDRSSSSSSSSSSSGGQADDAGGCWRVFADVCPHRLVPLSEGRITAAGLLECPYHGWAFNGQGACERIPQAGNLSTPRACATAFPCVVRQGMLFVKPQPLPKHPVSKDAPTTTSSSTTSSTSSSSSSSTTTTTTTSSTSSSNDGVSYDDVPVIPEFDHQLGWLLQDTWRDVPYDWSSLLENVLDASHVPFTHHKSISNRNTLGDYAMSLTQQVSPSGFKGLWQTGPRAGALGPQVTLFRPPCTMTHLIDAGPTRGYESMVVVYAVPIGPGKCRLLNRNAFRFVGGGWGAKLASAVMRAAPGWMIHLGTQVPLEDDQIFLHMGEIKYVAARAEGKTAAQAYYMPSRADTYVNAFRRWIQQFGGGGPFGDVGSPRYLARLEPRLSRPELLDRYSQHTASCAQCQKALTQLQLVRRVLGWLARIAGSLAVFTAAVAVAAAAATLTGPGSSSIASSAAAAAAAAPTGSVGQVVSSLLLGAAGSLAGIMTAAAAGNPGVLQATSLSGSTGTTAAAAAAFAAAGRAPVWLGAAVFCWLLDSQLEKLEAKFYHGDYPPPRNTDRAD